MDTEVVSHALFDEDVKVAGTKVLLREKVSLKHELLRCFQGIELDLVLDYPRVDVARGVGHQAPLVREDDAARKNDPRLVEDPFQAADALQPKERLQEEFPMHERALVVLGEGRRRKNSIHEGNRVAISDDFKNILRRAQNILPEREVIGIVNPPSHVSVRQFQKGGFPILQETLRFEPSGLYKIRRVKDEPIRKEFDMRLINVLEIPPT